MRDLTSEEDYYMKNAERKLDAYTAFHRPEATDATFQPSSTGGVKGKKQAQLSRVPVGPLLEVAAHFTKGADKYPDVSPGVANWSLGYAWSLSYDALQRHALAWWSGEDVDPETESHHLAAVVFHALALMEFGRTHRLHDDRPYQAEAVEPYETPPHLYIVGGPNDGQRSTWPTDAPAGEGVRDRDGGVYLYHASTREQDAHWKWAPDETT